MRIVAILVSFVASLAFTAAAHAQAAQHHGIPDPITTAELERYAARLMLSDEQRQAVQPLHDDYREQFRHLRESEIDRYIEDVREHRGRGEAWRQLQGRRDRIMAQIRAIDESLFAAIEPILTEVQQEHLPRVRLSRHRTRLMPAALMSMSGVEVVDLSELVLESELSAADRERIDPWISQYERRLTRLLEELPPVIAEARRQMNESGEEFRREMQENPANQREASERMMERNHEAQLAVQQRMVEIRVLGRQALFDVAPHLPDRSARQLRERFMSVAYRGRMPYRLRSPIENALDGLLAHEDVDSTMREHVASKAAHLRRAIEPIVREAMEAMDERDATTTTFSMMRDREAQREFDQHLDGIAARIREIEDPIVKELSASLPESAAAVLAQALPPWRRAAVAPEAPAAAPTAAPAAAPRPSIPRGGIVPTEITQREVNAYARALDLDEEGRELLRELHEEYLDRIAATAVEPSLATRRFFQPGDGDPEEFAAGTAKARRTAIEALERADRALFDAILEAFPDSEDAIDRLRLARERQRSVISPMASMRVGMMNMRGNSSDATLIDLSRLAARANIDLAAHPQADEAMLRYERELTKLLREAFDATVRMADAEDVQSVYFRMRFDQGEESEEGRQARVRAERSRREADQDLARIERDLIQLHERALDELLEHIPQQAGESLLHAYRERALPGVYRDPGAMEALLTKTLQMEDLNAQQRERLAELLGEYRGEYLELREMMHKVAVDIEDVSLAQRMGEAPPRGETSRLYEQIAKLRHDRQELNARTIVALKGILNDVQFARLGPMPDPTAQPRPMWIGGRDVVARLLVEMQKSETFILVPSGFWR